MDATDTMCSVVENGYVVGPGDVGERLMRTDPPEDKVRQCILGGV
jgi:hypothetical protein